MKTWSASLGRKAAGYFEIDIALAIRRKEKKINPTSTIPYIQEK